MIVCLHSLLLAKLAAYGMSRKSIHLVASYLTGRKQRVRLQSFLSEWLEIIKGIPQGSILGPILFNVFINDIIWFFKNSLLFNYADDNTIEVRHKQPAMVIEILQSECQLALDWFRDNLMQANPEKFHSMLFSGFKNPGEGMDSISLQGVTIPFEENCKLLGVNFDSNVNFSFHIEEVCKKAGRQLNALGRLSRKADFTTRLTIFRSFVVSNLDYCAIVWHFCNKEDSNRIEKIYERGIRLVYQDFDSSYSDLLIKANLPSLELKRQRTLAIEVYKALNDLSPSYICNLFNVSNTVTRGNDTNIFLPRVNKTFSGLHSFRYEGVKIWNELPDGIKTSPTLSSFKDSIVSWNGYQCKCNQCKNNI